MSYPSRVARFEIKDSNEVRGRLPTSNSIVLDDFDNWSRKYGDSKT